MAWDADFRLPETGFFTPVQFAQITVLFRALHPSDAARGIPGAEEAGAARFLDLLLSPDARSGYDEVPSWRTKYPVWLAALDAASNARSGKPLAELDVVAMTEFLTALEGGKLDGVADQATIFKTLWRHCLQGCWSDPRWGGNRDRIMWRWLGYLEDAQNIAVVG